MRRKYNDLLAKRAGMLTEAEGLLKEGKREDYRSKMTEIENLNSEITEVKTLIDEQDRQFMQKQDTPGEARDKALERAEILRKGGEVKFSAAEVRKAITLATTSLAEPTGVGRDIRGGDAPLSAIIDQVSVVNLSGLGEYQEPYVITELDRRQGPHGEHRPHLRRGADQALRHERDELCRPQYRQPDPRGLLREDLRHGDARDAPQVLRADRQRRR